MQRTKTLELRDIPNREGFKFIGIAKDNTRHNCEVYKDEQGLHRIKGIAYIDLAGWERIKEQKQGMTR